MQTLVNITQIVVAVLLILAVLFQVKSQGGGLFGSAESSYRTRRGLERVLFQFTIALVALFVIASIVSVRAF